jgi:hypothetical protein
MFSWLKSVGWLAKAFDSAMQAFQREQDRAAGRNEAEIINLKEKERVRKEADDVWDGVNRGRIKRVRQPDRDDNG